jgi:hypothetical protein
VTTVYTSTPYHGANSTTSIVQQQFQQRPHQTEQGYVALQHHVIKHSSNLQTPTAGNQNVQRLQVTPNTSKDPTERRCFNCEEEGHYAHVYPKPHLHPNPMPETNTSPNWGANSIPVTTQQNLAIGRVNQVAMAEAQDTPMTGTFLINSYSVLIILWPLFFSALRISGRDSF